MSHIPLSSVSKLSPMRSSPVHVDGVSTVAQLASAALSNPTNSIDFAQISSSKGTPLHTAHPPSQFPTHSLDNTRVYRSVLISPPAASTADSGLGDFAQLSLKHEGKPAKDLSLQHHYHGGNQNLPVKTLPPSTQSQPQTAATDVKESSTPPPLPSYLEASCFSIRADSTSSQQLWKSIQQHLSDQGMVVAESDNIPFELHCCVFSGTSTCEFHARMYEGHYSQKTNPAWLTVELQRRCGCGMLLMRQVREMLEWLSRTHDCQVESEFPASDISSSSDPQRTPTPPLLADDSLYSNLFDLLCSDDENLQLEGLNSLSLCLESDSHSFMSSACAQEVWSEVAKRLCLSANMSVQHAAAKLFEAAAKATESSSASNTPSPSNQENVISFKSVESEGLMACFPAVVAHLKTCAQSTSPAVADASSGASLCHSLPRTPCTLDEACRKHVEKCLLRGCLALHSVTSAADKPSPQIMSQFKRHLFQLSSNSRDADIRSLAQANIAMAMR